MIIIGIDPSLTSTGICTMDESGKLLSTLAINSGFSGMKRLYDIKQQIFKVLINFQLKPTVFIEGYSFGSMNGREVLGELGGMIRLMLYEEGIEFVDVAPTSLKKYATGIGKGDKVAMAIGVIKSWGKDFPTTDQTDAYALCQFGRGYLGLVDDLTVFRKEAIDAIKNPKVKKRAKK
jgi:crossover junction endodeoxyribonuclease RuvC